MSNGEEERKKNRQSLYKNKIAKIVKKHDEKNEYVQKIPYFDITLEWFEKITPK